MAEPIRIEVDDHAVRRLFAQVESRAKQLGPFYKAAGSLIKDSIQHNFDVGGRYAATGSWRGGSNRWKPLSADTLLRSLGKKDFKKSGALSAGGRRKAARRMPLDDGGNLKMSMTFRVTSGGVEVGTNKIQAATMNFGAKDRVIRAKGKKSLSFFFAGAQWFLKRVKVNIPARPFMVVQDEDIAAIMDIGGKHITEGL